MSESSEQEYTIKPMKLSKEKFEKEATEYLSKLEEYKLIDKTMKQFEANIKEYMVQNDIDIFSNDVGRITVDFVKVNCLNRALIEDIKQYYEETTRVVMRKTLKCNKPAKKF